MYVRTLIVILSINIMHVYLNTYIYMHIKDDVINYQLSTGWLIFDHSLLLSKVTSRLLAHHSLQDLFFGTSVEHAHTHTKKKGGHVFWVMKEAAIFLKLSQQQKHPIFLSFWSDLSVPPHGWESFCEKKHRLKATNIQLETLHRFA